MIVTMCFSVRGGFLEIVLLTALGVGGSTVFGAIIGFVFRGFAKRQVDVVTSFAAGVMLAATVIGLLVPAVEYATEGVGLVGVFLPILGIFVGAIFVDLIDMAVPRLTSFASRGGEKNEELRRTLLFVIAIAIHNLPEGIAAGVGFGTGKAEEAFLIAGGIALQNIPEGMVIIAPMLSAGIKPRRTFFYAALTGLVEVVGTFIGYFGVALAGAVLPFALAFAGGTMLYVINEEMIPSSHEGESKRSVAYAYLLGFSTIIFLDVLLG